MGREGVGFEKTWIADYILSLNFQAATKLRAMDIWGTYLELRCDKAGCNFSGSSRKRTIRCGEGESECIVNGFGAINKGVKCPNNLKPELEVGLNTERLLIDIRLLSDIMGSINEADK